MPDPGHKSLAKDRERLIREVTQRVWEMLREELRREQERRRQGGRRKR